MPSLLRLSQVTSPVLLALVAGVGAAAAQTPAALGTAPLVPLHYSSAINGYKSYADAPVQPWRDSNDRAASIGGWRAYAKEIQGGAPAKDAAPTSSPDPHAGHQMGGAKP